MLNWHDRMPWSWLLPLAVWMAIAPITPEPQPVEKLRHPVRGPPACPIHTTLLLVARTLWRQLRARAS